MGGKTATSTSQVQIPPEVLARYNSVNATAESAAQQPFQIYSNSPDAFVAPINQQQQAGMDTINNSVNTYQPYFAAATGAGNSAISTASPYYGAATSSINNAQGLGAAGLSSAYNPLSAGQAGANGLQGTAAGLTMAGAQPIYASDVNSDAVNKYMNPYLQTVLGGTLAPMIQQQQQQQSALMGNQILNGTFGGDRSGISQAVLAQQQNLALGQAAAGILSPAYETALGAAQQQQGVNLGAAQANRAALSGAGAGLAGLGQQVYGQGATTSQQLASLANQGYTQGANTAQMQAALGQGIYGMGQNYAQLLASLGTEAQQAGLAAGQAQLGAGTLGQQTSQAGLTALYNQFQQQQGYPFQVAQFLANIAEGTGALSGSTTTSTQPVMGLFSDERLKDDIKPIGKTFDGQNIIKFRYKGDRTPRIGLSAQEVEQEHPEAVGESGGYKVVDYDKATKDAEMYRGGLAVANGGTVYPDSAHEGFAGGGMPGSDIGSILSAHQAMYGNAGLGVGGGAPAGIGGYGAGIAGRGPSGAKLEVAKAPEIKQPDIGKDIDSIDKAYSGGKGLYKFAQRNLDPTAQDLRLRDSGMTMHDAGDPTGLITQPDVSADLPSSDELQKSLSGMDGMDELGDLWQRGGRVARDAGGLVPPTEQYPLSNTYQNYLAQQRQHPFTDTGLYGNPLISQNVGGPYGSQLEGMNPSLKLMVAEPPVARKYEPTDPSLESYERLSKSIEAAKKRRAAPAKKAGGRIGRDVGGYVPEPMGGNEKPQLMQPQQLPPVKDHTMEDIADIAKIAAMFAAKNGGRIKRADGGMSIPYSMGYVPEQMSVPAKAIQEAKNAGGGGGDSMMPLLGLAAHFLKSGGRVGYADGGSPDEPRMREWASNLGDAIVTPIERGLGSVWDAMKGDTSVTGDKPRGWLGYEPKPSAPAPVVEDVPHPTPRPMDEVLRPATQRPAMSETLPPLTGGQNVGLAPAIHSATDTNPLTGEPVAAAPTAPAPGLGAQPPSTDVIRTPDQNNGWWHRQARGLGIDLDATMDDLGANVKPSPGATPTSGEDSDFMSRNQSWLVPLLHGVGAATLYPGNSLIGGLAYGAMKGAESYSDIQNQMAERQLTGAETQATKASIFQQLQQNAPPNFMVVPGQGPNSFRASDGNLYHYVNKADFIGQNGPAGAPGQTPMGSQFVKDALTVDYANGNKPILRPSAGAQDYLAQTFPGYDPNASAVQNRARVFAMNPGLENLNKQEEERANQRVGNPNNTYQIQRQYLQLADAVNSLSADTASGRGASFEYRQRLANIYQTGRRLMGYPDDPNVSANLVAGDIINKIQSLSSTALADQSGQHSHAIAEALRGVLPGGEGQLASSNHILAQMLVANQQQRDFQQYYTQYVGKTGFAAGVNEAFQRDMGAKYDQEQGTLEKLFKKTPDGRSIYATLKDHPELASSVENGYRDRNGAWHPGLGVGITRYLQ